MYATAFQEKILNPGTILIDSPTCFTARGQKPYCPKNYDGSYKGPVTVRRSLGNSLNITAVKALRALGIEKFITQAQAMGITSWVDPSRYGLSLTLGGGEVRMIDLAQAFSVLANQGVKVPLNPIIKVEDYNGNILAESDFAKVQEDLTYLTDYDEKSVGNVERVMDRAPAYLTSHIMQDNQARQEAFGPRSELVIPNQVVSAKTGTTNDLRDNWTVGFTPEYLVVTWVGNNDNTPMNRRLVSGVTGAAPIWHDIMSYILKDRQPLWQEKPPDVESGLTCPTGMPPQPGESCQTTGPELYWTASNPSKSGVIKKNVWIDPRTGLPPKFGEQVEGLVLEERTLLEDPVTEMYCLDCTRAINEEGKPIQENQTIDESYSNENRVQEQSATQSQTESQTQTP
jgi:membrane peptidoglycan carboxypeptidase